MGARQNSFQKCRYSLLIKSALDRNDSSLILPIKYEVGSAIIADVECDGVGDNIDVGTFEGRLGVRNTR